MRDRGQRNRGPALKLPKEQSIGSQRIPPETPGTKDRRAITYSWFNPDTDTCAEGIILTFPQPKPHYIIIIPCLCPEVNESDNRLNSG